LVYFSGNKETLDINQFLKRSLLERSFFLGFLKTILNSEYKKYMLSSKIIISSLQNSNLIR